MATKSEMSARDPLRESIANHLVAMSGIEAKLDALYWHRHTQLSETEYDNKQDQIDDARKLGRIAETIATYREARQFLAEFARTMDTE